MEALIEDHDNDTFDFYIKDYAEDYYNYQSLTEHTNYTTTHNDQRQPTDTNLPSNGSTVEHGWLNYTHVPHYTSHSPRLQCTLNVPVTFLRKFILQTRLFNTDNTSF